MESLLIGLAKEPGINLESDAHVQLGRVGQIALHGRLQRRSRDTEMERRIQGLGLITTDQ